MKKLNKKDLMENFNKLKDNVVKAKEYAEDLIYVTKGFVFGGSRYSKEEYFINTSDLKQEMKEDFDFLHSFNEKGGNSSKYDNENTDIEYTKVLTTSSFYEDLKNGKEDLVDNLRKNDAYLETKIHENIEKKINKINDMAKQLNGSFSLEYTPQKTTLIINDLDNGVKTVDNLDEFRKFLKGNVETEDNSIKLSDFDLNFEKLTDNTFHNKASRNTSVKLYIDGKNIENNSLEIIRDDKKLSLKGEEVNLGEITQLKNYSIFIFDKEQDKIEDHLRMPHEIEIDLNRVKEKMLEKERFDNIKENIFSTILTDDNIKEQTDNFQKNTEDLKYRVMEIYEDIFTGLGTDFTNQFLVNNADNLGLTITDDNKIKEIIEIGGVEDYKKNLNEFVRDIYMEDVNDFGERMANFGNNFSTKIEDKFSYAEIYGYSDNQIGKLEKIYEDVYKYGKEKGFDDAKGFSMVAKNVGLEVNEFSDRYENIKKNDKSRTDSLEANKKEIVKEVIEEKGKDMEMDI